MSEIVQIFARQYHKENNPELIGTEINLTLPGYYSVPTMWWFRIPQNVNRWLGFNEHVRTKLVVFYYVKVGFSFQKLLRTKSYNFVSIEPCQTHKQKLW